MAFPRDVMRLDDEQFNEIVKLLTPGYELAKAYLDEAKARQTQFDRHEAEREARERGEVEAAEKAKAEAAEKAKAETEAKKKAEGGA